MNKIKQALLLSSAAILAETSLAYDANLGKTAMYYSAAAYCSYESIEQWDCGEPCLSNSGVSFIQRVSNSTMDEFAYVAYNEESDTIVVSVRGTNGIDVKNFFSDLSLIQTSYYEEGIYVHNGFLRVAMKLWAEGVKDNLQILIEEYPNSKILITGHSLGAAVATLFAVNLKRDLNPSNQIMIYTFGSPRVGNSKFADYFMTLYPNGEYQRVTHYDDPICHIPQEFFKYKHAGEEVWYYNKGSSLDFRTCGNQAGASENETCSNSLDFALGLDQHLIYVGSYISRLCNESQPASSIISKDSNQISVDDAVDAINQTVKTVNEQVNDAVDLMDSTYHNISNATNEAMIAIDESWKDLAGIVNQTYQDTAKARNDAKTVIDESLDDFADIVDSTYQEAANATSKAMDSIDKSLDELSDLIDDSLWSIANATNSAYADIKQDVTDNISVDEVLDSAEETIDKILDIFSKPRRFFGH